MGKAIVTKTILIVGSDLGFVFWLGQTLDAAGYQALPAKSTSDAAAILSHWSGSLDLLAISSKLPEARVFAKNLRAVNPALRVIVIIEPGSDVLPGADAACAKGRGDEVKAQWLETIDRLLSQVSNHLPADRSEPNQKTVPAVYPQKSHRSLQ